MDDLDTRLADLQLLLQRISRERLMDFSVYNQPMLLRRIQLRLLQCGQPDIAAYLAYLNDNPAEIDLLLNTILITVSHFFRNILTFACLRERVIPALVASPPRGTSYLVRCLRPGRRGLFRCHSAQGLVPERVG